MYWMHHNLYTKNILDRRLNHIGNALSMTRGDLTWITMDT